MRAVFLDPSAVKPARREGVSASVLLGVLLLTCATALPVGAQCSGCENCTEPCPVDPCVTDADCPSGAVCVHGGGGPGQTCITSGCSCDVSSGWVCTPDCGGSSCMPNGSIPCTTGGACCVGGDCSVESSATCQVLEGDYHGDGSLCDPPVCAIDTPVSSELGLVVTALVLLAVGTLVLLSRRARPDCR